MGREQCGKRGMSGKEGGKGEAMKGKGFLSVVTTFSYQLLTTSYQHNLPLVPAFGFLPSGSCLLPYSPLPHFKVPVWATTAEI